MAATMHTVGNLMIRHVAGKELVIVDELLPRVESCLVKSREEILEIYEIFLAAGVLKNEIELDNRRKAFSWELMQRLPDFVHFVDLTRRGATKKLIETRFFEREKKTLLAISLYAKKQVKDSSANCRLKYSEVEANLLKATGTELDPEAIGKARETGLIVIEGTPPALTLVFSPSVLSRSIAFMAAVQKLAALDAEGEH